MTTTEKIHHAIADWVGDIVALETHVEEAMDRQLKLDFPDPAMATAIQRFHDAVRDSKQRAEAYQGQYGSEPGNPIIKALFLPGIWVQMITTKQPTDDMIEVAIVSMEEALRADSETLPEDAGVLARVPLESVERAAPRLEGPATPEPAETPPAAS